MPSRADADDPVGIDGRARRIRCRICGYQIPLVGQGMKAWLALAEDFAAIHRHPKNEAPQRLDPAGERNENPRNCTHEHGNRIPPQALRQAPR